MGCSPSKQSEPEERLAAKRNATIERMIRVDKKVDDRTVKILLLGMVPLKAFREKLDAPS
jgi:guanine nucleotide-binding protein subunit alpha